MHTFGRMSALAPFSQPLPLGSIRPSGWLRAQLAVQATGLGGHLHEFWPDIRDSQWRGGSGEGWERVPYWLDGFLPLAFLLQDDRLITESRSWIDAILAGQHDDGWFGPVVANESHGARSHDPWPQFILFKVFLQWHEATGDERILPAMLRSARRIFEAVEETPLWDWAKFRWFEFAVSLRRLRELTGAAWIDDLIALIAAQGYDWRAHFADFKHPQRATEWRLDNHVVNHAMALKECLYRPGSGFQDLREALEVLDRFHGQANGMFSGDESLAGLSPSQGTELCAVVEAMFSLELAFAEYGAVELADRLELIAFNALPATFTKDMWAHQYDQQVNQVLCVDAGRKEDAIFTTNGPRSNLFGLEPNFGCCTANFHQGWPKFASHLWSATDGGLVATSLAPCEVRHRDVVFRVVTEYPHAETILIEPISGQSQLGIPIPTWANRATVDGNPVVPGAIAWVELRSNPIEITLPMAIRTESRPSGGVAVYVGPVLYALKIREEVTRFGDEPWADREVRPISPWNVALDLATSLELDLAGRVIRATGRVVKNWTLDRHAAGPFPTEPRYGDEVPIELVPYGSTLLRVGELPVVAVEQ